MAISKELQYVHVENLLLDAENPRLGRDKRKQVLSQDDLLKEMSKWTLDELVDSFAQSGGFWTQDALIAVAQKVDGTPIGKFTVVEGNRRLAAVKLLYDAVRGKDDTPKWLAERLEAYKLPEDDPLFTNLPMFEADQRDDVSAYLGFRHVTGIKEWKPAEKAEFIADLIDRKGLSYKEAAKQIGSRSDVVRQNYVAFKMLLQMEEIEGFDWSEVENRFSLLFLSIRSSGTRDFLGVELAGTEPTKTQPIPTGKKDNAKNFADWLFGSKEKKPVVRDSRNVDRFGEILAEPRAVKYLQETERPDFETAYSFTESNDLVCASLEEAARNIRIALSDLGDRGEEEEVVQASWPVIEASFDLAQTSEQSKVKAKELYLAA